MKNFKTILTIFILYQIAVILVLWPEDSCEAIFHYRFCESAMRYFIFCLIVPFAVFLLYWWRNELWKIRKKLMLALTTITICAGAFWLLSASIKDMRKANYERERRERQEYHNRAIQQIKERENAKKWENDKKGNFESLKLYLK